jgi:phosphoglycolate phosphatase
MDGSLTKDGKREIIRIALDALDPAKNLPAVMIGDRKHDIIGASENGIASIGITWGYGSRTELEAAGATHIIDTTMCLLACFFPQAMIK